MWRLEVLGTAALEGDGKILHPERKTVALLTYLALEGATPRSKIAGLLWPDSGESTARSNLRQLLSRLKKSTNAELVTTDDLLKVQGLEVDAANLKVLAFSNSDEALQSAGHLLAPHDYDDCPDFADWLFAERERLQLLRQNALNSKIKQLEQATNYSEALSYAQKLLEIEPLAEEVHRQVMRLHYLTGDRAAALAAFERCKNVLQKELGVEPVAETLKLVSKISAPISSSPIEFYLQRKRVLSNRVTQEAKHRAELPLRVLRPPMVGREEAWQRMSEAWRNHQAIFISGVPGVGKSRLMQEFVTASQKLHCLFEARLGDASVPYATNTRNFRKMLARFQVALEPSLKRELSRMLSEYGDAPAPISNESELVRFYDAQEKTVRLAMEAGLAALAYDDVQYVDAASLQGWLHSSVNHLGREDGVHLIASFRKGELLPETQKSLEHLVASGLAVLIELGPLPEQDVRKLIAHLGIAELQPLAEQLSRYTGGNPLFIIETIKHLIESEQLGTGTFALPTTGKVFALLRDRLGRLSTDAQRLAWTAAIAQNEFSFDLASSILAKSPFDLAEPFEELEATNIFSGLCFSHDLLFETALTTIPSPIKVYLHRKCAEELEKMQASPATIAEHWLNAGDEEKAVPFLVKAAELASSNFQLLDAAKIYERVANILETKDKPDEAFDYLGSAIQKLSGSNSYEQCERLIQQMFRLAHNNEQLAASFHVRSEYCANNIRDSVAAEADAREGLKYAETPKIKSFLLGDLSVALWQQDRLAEAVEPLREAIHIQEEHQLDHLAESLGNLSVVVQHLGHYHDALDLQKQSIDLLRKRSENEKLAQSLNNYAITLSELGYVKQSLIPLWEALELQRKMQGVELQVSLTLITLGQSQRDLCQFHNALESATEAFSISEQSSDPRGSYYAVNLAHIYLLLGQSEMSRVLLSKAKDNLIDSPFLQSTVLREEARWFIYQGQLSHALMILETAKQKLISGKRQLSLDLLDLLRADILLKDESLQIAKQVLEHAREGELKGGLAIGALTTCAKALLKLKRTKEALEHSQEAIEMLKTYDPDMIYLGEVFYSHYKALEACKSKSAKAYLEQTYTWLMDIANNNVPPEYRESFLNNNPTNKAILEAAQVKGLIQKTLV
jgi:DNA-binding SARP family transcriptional activator